MKTIALHNLGRFGNQMFRYAYARALAEQNGWELRTEPWVGEWIFGFTHERPRGDEDLVIGEYRQAQKDLIYSRADCRRWFKLKAQIEHDLEIAGFRVAGPAAHFRRGDYGSAGYPLVGYEAVKKAVYDFIGPNKSVVAVSDDKPLCDSRFTADLHFLPDFYRLMTAPVLFRANSSFSWWAATLGTGRVFSPIITGFAGGVEHDNIPYVEGNWPRLAELDFVTDLHLRET